MYDNGIFVVVFLTLTFCIHRPVWNIRQPVIPLTDCETLPWVYELHLVGLHHNHGLEYFLCHSMSLTYRVVILLRLPTPTLNVLSLKYLDSSLANLLM